MTEYAVFRQDGSGLWEYVAKEEAHSDEQAIRKVAGDEEGVFFATPARSFKPQRNHVERVTTARLSPADVPGQTELVVTEEGPE